MFCPKCGSDVANGCSFCPNCGQSLQDMPESALKPEFRVEKSTASLLAFFFGTLGVHDFYMGRTGQGVCKLLITFLLSWLVIPAIVVVIWVGLDLNAIRKGTFVCGPGKVLMGDEGISIALQVIYWIVLAIVLAILLLLLCLFGLEFFTGFLSARSV